MITSYEIENIVVPYLKEHMKLKWMRDKDGDCYLAIFIGKEIITKVKFSMD